MAANKLNHPEKQCCRTWCFKPPFWDWCLYLCWGYISVTYMFPSQMACLPVGDGDEGCIGDSRYCDFWKVLSRCGGFAHKQLCWNFSSRELTLYENFAGEQSSGRVSCSRPLYVLIFHSKDIELATSIFYWLSFNAPLALLPCTPIQVSTGSWYQRRVQNVVRGTELPLFRCRAVRYLCPPFRVLHKKNAVEQMATWLRHQ